MLFQGRPFGFVGGSGSKRRIRPGALRAQLRGDPPPAGRRGRRLLRVGSGRPDRHDGQAGHRGDPDVPEHRGDHREPAPRDPELLAGACAGVQPVALRVAGASITNTGSSPPRSSLWWIPTARSRRSTFALERARRRSRCCPGRPRGGVRRPIRVYDPFWARVRRPGLLVTYHLGNSGYMEHYSADWGENPDPDGIPAWQPIGRGARPCQRARRQGGPVGVPVDHALPGPADHGHACHPDLPQPVRTFPQASRS